MTAKNQDNRTPKDRITPSAGPAAETPQANELKSLDQCGFPSISRCPRCGANDTVADKIEGDIQKRHCVRPICRYKYNEYKITRSENQD